MKLKMDDLAEIVGEDNLLQDTETLEKYKCDASFERGVAPVAVVRPKNAEQVQEIVKWAQISGNALIPVSSEGMHFYGATLPQKTETVIVDMSRMNKIIRINRKNRVAIIEPGVTYGQLRSALEKEGLTISNPLLPHAEKSVIASLLEREPTVIPKLQWAFLDPLRCIEVVWGDGNKMTTGDAASVGTLEEEWELGYAQIAASGPQQTDFYKVVSAAQGSMGIVTWASVRCEIKPETQKLLLVQSNDLNSLIDPLYEILRIRFADELLILNNWQLASIVERKGEKIANLAEKLAPFNLLIGIAGRFVLPEEKVKYQTDDISAIMETHGLALSSDIHGVQSDELLKAIQEPCSAPYYKFAFKGSAQDIFFLTTLDKSPLFIDAFQKAAEKFDINPSRIGIYIQPVHQGTACHLEFSIPYDNLNPTEAANIKEFYNFASNQLFEAGAYYSRPYDIWADMAYNKDEHTAEILQKIKGIFDPNNIMNPGKLCFQV